MTIAPVRAQAPAIIEELFRDWQLRGDRRARDELFAQFSPLARNLAGRYPSASEPLEDLVQVASVGLLGAIDRFDSQRGVAFTSFAIPTVLGELKRHFRNTGWSVHVPRGAQEMALRVDQASRQLTVQTGRAPRVDAVAAYLEVRVEDVLTGLKAGAAHYSISLDTPVPGTEDGESLSLADGLGDDDDRFGLIETKLSLSAAISRLPYLERRTLKLRMEHDMKQIDIAHRIGCSQMQVSRLLRRAATNVRHLTDPVT